VESYRSLGFWVLAPQSQISADVFACVSRVSVEQKIRSRVGQYEIEWREKRLDAWWRDWLLPLLDRLQLACVPWEQVIADIQKAEPDYGAALKEFYGRCIEYNGPRQQRGAQQPAESLSPPIP